MARRVPGKPRADHQQAAALDTDCAVYLDEFETHDLKNLAQSLF